MARTVIAPATITADFLVIGGGIAGMSAAAGLARHGRVVVLEAEEAFGYHSSGRSATFYHFGIGNDAVRGLTAASRPFFDAPPDGFSDAPLARPAPALFIATADMVAALAALEADMRRYTDTVERVDKAAMQGLVPVLRFGEDGIVAGVLDRGGRRLDADRLQQSYARAVRRGGGETVTGARVAAIARRGGSWGVETEAGGRYRAPVLLNAAGAWADAVGRLAGLRPLGLAPMRRTIIVFDPPAQVDARGWPFTKTAVDDFYMLPEAGRLLASPVDEVPSPALDAQPEDYDLALAAWKVEQYTSLTVPRLRHSWAGLRTFAADRTPVAGFAPDADGFFWLAGQGGYGLQTAPAMSAAVEALVTGARWPEGLTRAGVGPTLLDPARLLG